MERPNPHDVRHLNTDWNQPITRHLILRQKHGETQKNVKDIHIKSMIQTSKAYMYMTMHALSSIVAGIHPLTTCYRNIFAAIDTQKI
jgi:hypothetical protein